MNNLFSTRPLSFDAGSINDTIQRALASAGIDTASGPMKDVTNTIRQALSSAGGLSAGTHAVPAHNIIDVVARLVPEPSSAFDKTPRPAHVQKKDPGTFVERQFTSRVGTRAYKVYIPARRSSEPMPVIVMLHGCTQSADDFAAGTRMNSIAEEHGFLVVYPEQPSNANMSRCWNWFKSQDQLREGGEPALIAGIALEVAKEHGADRRRVYVAGLSAGAAMAVILGETYPDVFAGIGVHSGLPFASAHDIPSAMVAMKGGKSGMPGLNSVQGAGPASSMKTTHAVPTIVFHGDRDHTVQQANGDAVVRQASEAHARAAGGGAALSTTTRPGQSPGGRSFTRTVQATPDGVPFIESWTLHGAGHAWSGGDSSGSYTDANGPDASAEMVRFFLARTPAGTA